MATDREEGWPLPIISQVMHRLGEKRAKIYGTMDMTSGYHQAPIAAESRIFTAFITFMGVFQWTRVPMGLKSAGSYFQRVMATVVLAGLLYIICELYLDDILVYGKDENDFVSNLRKVFVQLRRHKVTLGPAKCRFGFSTIEYVGHTITPEGLTFSEKKREKCDQQYVTYVLFVCFAIY
jgi:hypothetical protein